MLPDTDAHVRPLRSVSSRIRAARVRPVPTGKVAHPGEWQISGSHLLSAQGQRFRVTRHGIDKYEAMRLIEFATVIYGEYPDLTEITNDPDLLGDAIGQISTRGDLFSVYASVYRSGSRTVLLLDYLR